jgi:hypothetical protein
MIQVFAFILGQNITPRKLGIKAKINKSNYFFLKLFKKHLLISKYILYIQAKRKKYQLPRTKMAVGESNQTTKKQHVL